MQTRHAVVWIDTNPNPDLEEAAPVNLSDLAAAVKAASADDAAESDTLALDEIRKVFVPDSISAPAPEVLTKAAKATEDLDEVKAKLAEVTTELAATKAKLADIGETVLSSGPVRIRPQADAAKAATLDALESEAQRYDRLGSTVTDPQLAAGYRQLAAEKRAAADLVKA